MDLLLSVSPCRVCYDAFCTMTSDGRTRSIQHPDSSAACHYFCLLTPIVLFLFLWNIEFHMAGCESVIHLEISLYFHIKSWGWISAVGRGWVMKPLLYLLMLHCCPLVAEKELVWFLIKLVLLYFLWNWYMNGSYSSSCFWLSEEAGVAVLETGNAAYDLVQFSNIC